MATNETELQSLIASEATNPTPAGSEETITEPLDTAQQSETVEDLALPTEIKPEIESLKKIAATKADIMKVKESLGSIIDTMSANPSIITRAATMWGELPLWQKIVGGVVLSGPTLAAGLFAHIGVLLVIGGVTGAAYTTSGLILQDHHTCNVNIVERLKAGVFSLADLLQVTIDALDRICQELKVEVEKFAKENVKLAENVSNLQDEVGTLTNQVELFIATQKLLRETRIDLEKTAKSLQESVEDQTQLLQKNEELLTQVKHDFEVNQQQLSEKVAELQEVREAMGLEVEKVRVVGDVLLGTVTNLSSTVVSDTAQRDAFKKKLEEFLSDKGASFDKAADRICKAEQELGVAKRALVESTERYKELLDRQEEQVARLAEIDKDLGEENVEPKINTKGLHEHGIYKSLRQSPNIPIIVNDASFGQRLAT